MDFRREYWIISSVLLCNSAFYRLLFQMLNDSFRWNLSLILLAFDGKCYSKINYESPFNKLQERSSCLHSLDFILIINSEKKNHLNE